MPAAGGMLTDGAHRLHCSAQSVPFLTSARPCVSVQLRDARIEWSPASAASNVNFFLHCITRYLTLSIAYVLERSHVVYGVL